MFHSAQTTRKHFRYRFYFFPYIQLSGSATTNTVPNTSAPLQFAPALVRSFSVSKVPHLQKSFINLQAVLLTSTAKQQCTSDKE